jgi:Fic family protein
MNDKLTTAKFSYFPIKLYNPTFDSILVNTIFEIERITTTSKIDNYHIFFELRKVLFDIEMTYSVRIEGNNTTIGQYLDAKNKPVKDLKEKEIEIMNLDMAMMKIVLSQDKSYFSKTEAGLLELHKLIVNGLKIPPKGDGDPHPGEYKKLDNEITNSKHLPAMLEIVPQLMDELFKFVNNTDQTRYDYLKIAQFHHYLTWIHPFANGNGRVGRMVTLAQLMNVNKDHYWFVNPAMVFGQNRQLYYNMLAKADEGTESGVLSWCEYFLTGILNQFQKNLYLGNQTFINSKVILPALAWLRNKKIENNRTIDILIFIAKNDYKIKSDKLNEFFKNQESAVFRSRILKNLVQKKYLRRDSDNSRLYILSLENTTFRKAIIYELAENNIIQKNIQDEL